MLLEANNQQWGGVMQSNVKQSCFYHPEVYYFLITAVYQRLQLFFPINEQHATVFNHL